MIVRACLAMRNNDGGYLIISFIDDGTPDTKNAPSDVTVRFHADAIQELVSKFASHAFDVTVEIRTRDGQQYPILCVPSGVETPVCAKSIVPNPDVERTPLVEPDAVYVRSVTSNNRVSTTKARREDWDRLVRICFDNREANIGAFVRRHLAGVDPKTLLDALSQIASAASAAFKQPAELVAQFESESLNRFESVVAERSVKLPDCGFWQASAVLSGDFPNTNRRSNSFDVWNWTSQLTLAGLRWLGHMRLETTGIYVESQISELLEIADRASDLLRS